MYQNMTADGDPYKFAEKLHQLVAGADGGKKIPLFLPVGEDALEELQDRLKRMNEVLVGVTPWSADLKKDHHKAKAKL